MGARSTKFRTNWSGPPARGTKANEVFLALLEGVASDQASARWGVGWGKAVEVLTDMCGYDIRKFKDTSRNSDNYLGGRGRKHPMVYKIVGRHKWSGGYVSFVKPEDYA